jgi:acyl-CoA thioesterase-1
VTIPLVCPADINRQSLDGRPPQITYSAPTVPGDTVRQVVCSPASGSLFRAGATTRVSCQVPEAPELITACAFNVSVVIPPQLSVIRFMAFGDSITDGFVLCDPCPSTFVPQWSGPLDLFNGRFGSGIFIHAQPEKSYPYRLQAALAARYTVQSITVTNRGLPGERASQGRLRLPGELMIYRPEVLLLFEGINDINVALVTAPGQRVSVLRIRDDLRAMVQSALATNVKVMLATLTPVASRGTKADPLAAEAVIRLNQEIRGIAAAFSLGPVVDLHAALSSDPTLIGADGLHPTAAGYQRIADTFFQAIAARYDVTPLAQPVPAPSTSGAEGIDASVH